MNTKILNTLLVLTPKKLQQKAMAKALNFLFPGGFFISQKSRTVEFCLVDLKRSWTLQMNESGFHPTSGRKQKADVYIGADLNTVVAAQDSKKLADALEQKTIEIIAEQSDVLRIAASLSAISQKKLDELVAYGYRFFKLTPKSRINIQTVTLEDIRIQKDVDFIRDEAVKLEKADLNEALRLMEIAHQARPSGPFIAKKVIEYRSALDK